MTIDNGTILIVASFMMFLFLIYVVVRAKETPDGIIKILASVVVVSLAIASAIIVQNEKIATGLMSMFGIVLGALLAREKIT